LLAVGSNFHRRSRSDVIFLDGAVGCGTGAQSIVQYKKSVFSMRREIPAVIVAPTGAFRDALESNLHPPAFRVITTKTTLSDIGRGELPRSEPYLVVIECGESLGPHTAQIAELKRQNPLARVVLVGQRWTWAEIASAFEVGAEAYFAEAAMSKEFMQAVNLITR
jgi:DNA-binding NarL/FixJ family response regulator